MGLEVEDALEEGFKQPPPQPAEGDDGKAAAAAEKLKLAEQQAVEKGKRAEEDAKREVDFIRRSPSLRCARSPSRRKRTPSSASSRRSRPRLARQDEHKQKVTAADDEHKKRMSQVDERETELNIKDKAREAMGGIEKNIAIADERTKAADGMGKAVGTEGVQKALKQLSDAQTKSLRCWARSPRKSQWTGLSTGDGSGTAAGILEYSGNATSTPADKTASTGRTAAVTAVSTSTTGTLTQADEVAVAAVGHRVTVTAVSWNSSFAVENSANSADGSGNVAMLVDGDLIVAATTALNPQQSWTTSDTVVAAIATYKAAGAAATRPVKMAGAWNGYAGESGGFAG
jgi:hypothetical protein